MKGSITILVVDDEPVMRKLLEKALTRDGYQVVSATEGNEALEILRDREINIVISDMKMPGMDGFELLKRIKTEHQKVGVIAMTAYGDAYTVKDALLLGADEYITKPFKSFEVSLIVERTYWRVLSDLAQKP
jgi:CheY-like chemotaxis protein